MHFLVIIPLLWIGLLHSQEKACSKFSDHLRTECIRELVTVLVQETNTEPLLPISQMGRFHFKELQQVTGVGSLMHFLFRKERRQILNSAISSFPIIQSRAKKR